MGYMSALGMRGAAGEDIALAWHLSSNHYPPIPAAMLPVAKRALKLARKGAPWDTKLRLPKGVTHRVTGKVATLGALVEHMHLEAFLDGEPDGDA